MGLQSYKNWTRAHQKELLLFPYTDGILCHHMVAVVKSSIIEGLIATNSMPVWWTMECWHNQYHVDTHETCHFDMDALRSTPEDAAMRYCPPYAAPEKQDAQRITSARRVPLKERKGERALGVHMMPWWMTANEKRKRKVTAPARYPKRARNWSQI